jgi:hypothetical protein
MKRELNQLKFIYFVMLVLSFGRTVLLIPGPYNDIVPAAWVISGFHCCVNEAFGLLGYYAALGGSSRRFGTTRKGQVTQLLGPSRRDQ